MKRLPVSLLVVFFLVACGGGGSGISAPPVTLVPERVTFSGAGDVGIFDPSVAFDPATGNLWMSYSSGITGYWKHQAQENLQYN